MRYRPGRRSARETARLVGLRLLGSLRTCATARLTGELAERVRHTEGLTDTVQRSPRLLLIRPDHLGDVLLTVPAGMTLRSALPSAQIDWIVGPWAADIVHRAPHANHVLTCRFPGFTRVPTSSAWEPYRELVRQARRLRRRGYVAALILRSDHWWGAMLAAAAGIPLRFGHPVAECHPFLTHHLPGGSTSAHAVEQGWSLARLAVAVLAPDQRVRVAMPSFSILPEERARADEMLSSHTHPRSGRLVAIHPGSGSPIKNWLPARWHEVLAALQASGFRAVLTGSAAEAPTLAEIAGSLDPAPTVLAGRTSLGELAAVFERCAIVLGGDSGPLHLAAAIGTPTLRLYGPTNRRVFGPWGDPGHQVAVQAQLPCQPCGNIVAPPCGATATPACLRVISAADVRDGVLRMLDTAKSPLRC